MKKKSLIYQIFTILILVFIFVSLTSCTGKSNVKKPEGLFLNTQIDYGDGFSPVEDTFDDEYLDFKSNGSGVWTLSFEMDFKWKLKDDALTITREVFNKKEEYKAVWDGEKILLDYDGTILLFEKVE